ncbi:MAG TPA: RteC domain-containing protein [Saprospiraceae bacterium]|nr:RteC domain-containing protein [Saprospiraceae bacterium]
MLSEKLHIILSQFLGKYPDPFDVIYNSDASKERCDTFIALSKELAEYERDYKFISMDEEIQYYKYDKPAFQHLGIYYERVCKLEWERLLGDKLYYTRLLDELVSDSNMIKDEIKYFRSRQNYLDEMIFRKESKDNHIFALIKALEMIEKYLLKAEDPNSVEDIIASYPKIQWTGSIAELSELINGLKLTNVINNGEMSLEEISNHISKFFNVEIKDIHGSTHELYIRKETAKYSNKMKTKIEQKRDDLIEKDYQRKIKK